MSFSLLNEKIQNLLKQKGIEEETLPQLKAIPEILKGKNVLLIAPTGLGKTESAILPIFHLFLQNKREEGISILYITPLRALNRDLLQRLFSFGKELGINIAVRHGDTTLAERIKLSKFPPNMLITTPETFQLLFLGRNLREHLKTIKFVIIDEIHELAGEERGYQLSIGLERLNELTNFQRIGLSATIGNEKDVANFLSPNKECEIIKVSTKKLFEVSVEFPEFKKEDKNLAEKLNCEEKMAGAIRRCKELIEEYNSILFFVNTRDNAEFLSARYKIWEEKFPIGIHHGSLSKDVRISAENDFKEQKLKALICTSSLELGIDVGSVDFTLQFNSPRQVVRLIQRIGRSGHKIGKVSLGKIIAVNENEIFESLVIARKCLNEEIEEIKIRENSLSVLANQIVAFSLCGNNNIEKTYEIIKRAHPFRNLNKEKFLDLLEFLKKIGLIAKNEEEFWKGRNARKYFYSNISMILDEKTYKIRDITTRQIIGTLDESFVSIYLSEEEKFVVKGNSWKVVEIKEDEVLVQQIKEIARIPSWVGEEIPVPYEVAQEVGKLRRELSEDKY